VDADGRLLAFSVVADQARNTVRAEAALDRVAAAIAACGCS
jgi:D-alanyl-D-alanine carboxypeptidase/D-alanyl-D-alanine-endopeptidase (penicillin-binding protein 4)